MLPVHYAARTKENTKVLKYLIGKTPNALDITCGRIKHTVAMVLL